MSHTGLSALITNEDENFPIEQFCRYDEIRCNYSL